ncbi:hypothetical protein R3P38DRAFT_2780737 [Favolaschia claudopus]|uniref:Uncharacterized protein n=1 Tax=Favolaschia claudopus TaxID=2862362 RepID=A0AAW0B7N4_9AGAR
MSYDDDGGRRLGPGEKTKVAQEGGGESPSQKHDGTFHVITSANCCNSLGVCTSSPCSFELVPALRTSTGEDKTSNEEPGGSGDVGPQKGGGEPAESNRARIIGRKSLVHATQMTELNRPRKDQAGTSLNTYLQTLYHSGRRRRKTLKILSHLKSESQSVARLFRWYSRRAGPSGIIKFSFRFKYPALFHSTWVIKSLLPTTKKPSAHTKGAETAHHHYGGQYDCPRGSLPALQLPTSASSKSDRPGVARSGPISFEVGRDHRLGNLEFGAHQQ